MRTDLQRWQWHRALKPLSIAALLGAGVAMAAQASAADEPSTASAAGAIQVLQVRPNFYMLTVDGVNVGLETGPEGSVVVNTGPASSADAMLKMIHQLSPKWIRFIVDTSGDPDLIGANDRFSGAGQSMMIGYGLLGQFGDRPDTIKGHELETRAPIIARYGVLEQILSNQHGGQAPLLALPNTQFGPPQSYSSFRINGDIINVVAMPPAHSNADAAVLFRRADVVVTGAIFDDTHFPVIDVAHGGSINGEIAAIQQVMNTLVVASGPVVNSEDGTMIIPVRGPVCNMTELLAYHDMLYAVRNRVDDLIKHGKSLEQVEAADPTQGYSEFGSETGPWTTKDFVEAVYRSLKTTQSHQNYGG